MSSTAWRHEADMVILGLTGSIGMGKSTAANAFRRLGIPVFDADAEVHGLLRGGGAGVAATQAAFPGVVKEGAVDREALGRRVFADEGALHRLEGILHPLVGEAERRFLRRAALRRAGLVVLDVPLLFETGADKRCDAVVVVSSPARVQRARVLSRPGMTEEKLLGILSRQLPDLEKRRRADFVVGTGLGLAESLRAIKNIVKLANTRRGLRWSPRYGAGGRRTATAKRPQGAGNR